MIHNLTHQKSKPQVITITLLYNTWKWENSIHSLAYNHAKKAFKLHTNDKWKSITTLGIFYLEMAFINRFTELNMPMALASKEEFPSFSSATFPNIRCKLEFFFFQVFTINHIFHVRENQRYYVQTNSKKIQHEWFHELDSF